jgi:hypothetical protein
LSLTLRALADTKQDLDAAIANGNVALPNSNDPDRREAGADEHRVAPRRRPLRLCDWR